MMGKMVSVGLVCAMDDAQMMDKTVVPPMTDNMHHSHSHMKMKKMEMPESDMKMAKTAGMPEMEMKMDGKMEMNMDGKMEMNMGKQMDMSKAGMKGMDMTMYMMPMTFWQGNENPNLTFLFRTWTTKSFGTYLLGMLFTVVVAMSVEGFNYALKSLHKKTLTPEGISLPNKLLLSLLYFFMITAGYMSMLLVMTFNIEVILAVVLGLTIANLIVYLVGARNGNMDDSETEE